MNVESSKQGGVAEITAKCRELLEGFTSLDTSVLR